MNYKPHPLVGGVVDKKTNQSKFEVGSPEYIEERRIATNESRRKYYWKNRERELASVREWNRRNREHVREYNREYHQKNRERLLPKIYERSKKWRLENPEKKKEGDIRWINANIERVRITRRRKLRRRHEVQVSLPRIDPSSKDLKSRKALFQNKCAYCCKTTNSLTLDHVVPMSIGGTDDLSNLVFACRSCNSSKQDREMQQWYRSKPFFSEERLSWILSLITN